MGTSGCADDRQTRSALELPISFTGGGKSLSAVFISALTFPSTLVCFGWERRTSFVSDFVFPSTFCCLGWGGQTTCFMLAFLFPSTVCCLGGGLTAPVVSAFLFFPYTFCCLLDTTLPVSFRSRFCRWASTDRMVYCGQTGWYASRKWLISCKYLGFAFIACG